MGETGRMDGETELRIGSRQEQRKEGIQRTDTQTKRSARYQLSCPSQSSTMTHTVVWRSEVKACR